MDDMSSTKSFGDINGAISYVLANLPNLPSDVPESFRSDLAHHFVLLFDDGLVDVWPAPPRTESTQPSKVDIGAPFDYARSTYTIRQGDLAHLGTILVATLVIFQTMRRAGWNLYNIAEYVLSAVLMLRRLREKGVHVTPLQRQVLLTIRKNRAITLDALAQGAIAFGPELTKAEVEDVLAELQAVTLNDGTVVPLVYHDADGRWSTDARGLWEVPVGVSYLEN